MGRELLRYGTTSKHQTRRFRQLLFKTGRLDDGLFTTNRRLVEMLVVNGKLDIENDEKVFTINVYSIRNCGRLR